METKQPELFPLRRPALRYHGGKWFLAPWIISFFPPHDIYVEPFGGAASVLLRKKRSRVEVYNDLDGEVVDLFRILRNEDLAAQLIRLINLTPFAREEFKNAYRATDDRIERARRLVFRSFSGFGSQSYNAENSNGFRWMASKPYAQEWSNLPPALQAVTQRMMGVTIENDRADRVIERQDSAETLFFLDPPYCENTRQSNGKGYRFEMLDGEHEALAEKLQSVKGKVLICGYPSGLYDRLYRDWNLRARPAYANGQKGRSIRTEVVWANYELPSAPPCLCG
jgi:DNA adenine methylase